MSKISHSPDLRSELVEHGVRNNVIPIGSRKSSKEREKLERRWRKKKFRSSHFDKMVPDSSMRRMKIRTAAKAEERRGNSIKLTELCECTSGFYALSTDVTQI